MVHVSHLSTSLSQGTYRAVRCRELPQIFTSFSPAQGVELQPPGLEAGSLIMFPPLHSKISPKVSALRQIWIQTPLDPQDLEEIL